MGITQKSNDRHLIDTPKIQVQRGQTCKLYALSNAINWLEDNYTKQTSPIQVRKHKNKTLPKSLRTVAKNTIDSQVGEVYGDQNFLAVAKAVGFDNFKSTHCDSTEQFCNLIVAAIQHNIMPIVMFDVNVYTGYPFNDNGNHEHAVVVQRYYYNKKKELMFEVGQWGKTYHFFAQQLAESNFQLAEQHAAESFIKYTNGWMNLEDFTGSDAEKAKWQQRTAQLHTPQMGTYKQKVILAAPNGIDYKVDFNAQPKPTAKANQNKSFGLSQQNKLLLGIGIVCGILFAGMLTVAILSGIGILGLTVGKTVAFSLLTVPLFLTFLTALVQPIKEIMQNIRSNAASTKRAKQNVISPDFRHLINVDMRDVEFKSKFTPESYQLPAAELRPPITSKERFGEFSLSGSRHFMLHHGKTSDDKFDTFEHYEHQPGTMPRSQPC